MGKNTNIRSRLRALRKIHRASIVWWRKNDRRYGLPWRIATGSIAVLMFVTAAMPMAEYLMQRNDYVLSAATRELTGKTDAKLTKLLKFDGQGQQYRFNADAVKDTGTDLPPQLMKKSVGAPSKEESLTYAVDVPVDMSKGVTYHDTNSQVSFSLLPQFKAREGRQVEGHLVYPMSGGAQAIYTLKNNGLKEDIIVPKVSDDTMRFTYDLKLPKSLEAKVIPDGGGSIGIYSADPMLFGDISYGSDADRTKVEQAREKADKTFLVFGLPAPVIVAPKGKPLGNASARFELTGTTLTVVAEDLEGIDFPISIDPSVVITSTADFSTNGNDEGMIDFATNGQITRGGLTGASVGNWTTSANTYTGTREKAGAIAYGGYLYVMGGGQRSPAVTYDTVQYTQINSANGSLGTWTSTTNLPAIYNELNDSVAVYNGYLYLIGGVQGSPTNQTWYIPINANGSLGATWTAGTPLWQIVAGAGTVAYRGHMYVLGGTDGWPGQCNTACLNTVRYAALNADGSLGAWVPTTSFTNTRYYGRAIAHNGYIYIVGGGNAGFLNSVEYAPINADGSLGAWQVTTGFTGARYGHVSYIYRGYMYLMGGWTGGTTGYMNDVQYAQVNADGTVGDWKVTTTFTNGRNYMSGASWNGYLYILGGYNPNSTPVNYNDTQYTKISPAGMLTTFGNTTSIGAGRAMMCAVAHNGHLYALGGSTTDDNMNNQTTVYYAGINADGALAAFNTTTALPEGRSSMGCAVANGYLYVMGGSTGSTVKNKDMATRYIKINADGTLAASWTSGINLPSGLSGAGAVVYTATNGNTYLYLVAPDNGDELTYNKTYYCLLDAATGAITSCTQSTGNMVSNYQGRAVVNVGKYIYAYGGGNTGAGTVYSAVEYTSINNDGTLAPWQATTAMPGIVGFSGGAVVNGCIYSMGGQLNSYVSAKTVYYACPNASGAISSWQTAPGLVSEVTDVAGASYGGHVYAVGGYRSQSNVILPSVQYAGVNNGGSGAVGAWGATTSLAAVRTHHSSVIYNGYIYVAGGYSGTDSELTTAQFRNDVVYAKINSNGTVGTWQAATSFTTARSGPSLVAYNGYMYLLGGASYTTAAVYYNDVQYAKINANGQMGSWQSTTSFTTGRQDAPAMAHNGYMYILGGKVSGGMSNTVQYAPIAANGTLGTWQATTSFATARQDSQGVIYNGYLYIIGGDNNGATYRSDVQYVKINANGTVGTWANTTSMMVGRQEFAATVHNGFLYVIGGDTDVSGSTTDVHFAPIHSDGTLGRWDAATPIPGGRHEHTAVAHNGFIYSAGGRISGTGPATTVNYAPLKSIARIARYSKVIDLGSPMSVSGIVYNGSVPGGAAAITYRAAGVNGVFGTNDNPVNISAVTTCTTNVPAARYILLSIVLDDIATGVFSDKDGTPSYLSDISIRYLRGHPDPDIRLKLGKTLLENEGLSPLDICFG